MRRSVSCFLAAQVLAPAMVELQVALAGRGAVDERMSVTLDGVACAVTELSTAAGGRLHTLEVAPGRLEVAYSASVSGREPPVAVDPLDPHTYVRPSRYAESDRLAALAGVEFGGIRDPADLVRAVSAWVGTRLAYLVGSSVGTDGAVDTLAAGTGVCRDYAHLAVALLRARDVPARVVAVYAPGLFPMDFHAVAEGLVDGRWCVVDPTLLAPRTSLLRIATGRDAADTAFLSNYRGEVRLDVIDVRAVTEGDLPGDDLAELVALG